MRCSIPASITISNKEREMTTEPTCSAHLRDLSGQLLPEATCARPAVNEAADVFLCDHHYRQARAWAEQVGRVKSEMVYYVQRADGLIKIGTSRMIIDRLAALAREHGSLTIMATHGGGHPEETAVHRAFKALRVEGEWFRPGLPLLLHIKKVHIETGNLQPEELPARINRPELNRMIREARKREGAA
jgi:hypothetical protein